MCRESKEIYFFPPLKPNCQPILHSLRVMLLITWQKLSPIFAFLSGKIGFWLPNALQTCTNHVCQPVWVNSCKHQQTRSWEKCKWTTKFWFKQRTLKKQGTGKTGWQLSSGSLLSVNISHRAFFFNAHFMNVNEKLKSRPTLTVVRLSNVKDLICPFSKNTFNTFGIRSRESSLSIVWKRLRVKSLSAVIKK